MSGTWLLLVTAARAATLDVALADKVGTLHVPSAMDVGVSFQSAGATPTEASWANVESNTISFACSDKGTPPADDRVEQVLLQVGEQKWALAPGSAVKLACPAGKVTVLDLHGTSVGSFAAPVTMTITKAKSRAER